MAGEKEWEDFHECEPDENANGNETESEDFITIAFCANCPAVHMDICNGDWSALLTLDANTARRVAADLFAATDQLDAAAPSDWKQLN